MVDAERVDRMLDKIAADIAHLAQLRDRGAALLGDRVALDSVKYTFVTAIEGCVRVAHHLVVSQRWRVQDSDADAVRALGQNGVVEREVSMAVALAVGFRDVLVHEYTDVDDAAVVANLDRLDDLTAFVAQVAKWMETN